MTNAKKNCDTCNKSSLSLLLLRPSPIAKSGALMPPGAASVTSDDAVTVGLLPKRVPTESRFALRLLRAGYVHVYIPNPPPGMRHWLVYRVTDQADLVPESTEWFKQQVNVTCSTSNHNPVGMKLLDIPQAHKISEIWIAYSANLWSDTLRGKNRANPKVMQKIRLAGGSPNTFQPTAANLKSKVLECALSKLSINAATDHDFAFNSMAQQVDKLAENMVRAAACHPKTKGKELAVVLGDPVGIATELNELRLRRQELAKQEIEKPEHAHPLNSSNALMGLKQTLLDENLAASFEQVSPLRTKTAFDQSKDLPAGTEWQPLSAEQRQALIKSASSDNWLIAALKSPYKTTFEQENIGRVIYPDHEARAAAWARTQTEKTWSQFTGKYDEAKRKEWVGSFEARMKSQHYDPLTKYEADWMGALADERTLAYFKDHFDSADPNTRTKHHSPGTVYAAEVHRAYTPAPQTQGEVLDQYLAMFKESIADEKAVVLRALVANQQWAIDQIASEIDSNKRDKLYDFMKGLVSGAEGTAQGTMKAKYSWLGDVVGGYSVGLWGSAVAALSSAMARSPQSVQGWNWLLNRLQGLAMVRQAIDLALQATLQGGSFKVPVLVKVRLPIDEAMQLLRDRAGQDLGVTRSRLKRLKKNQGTIELSLLTDNRTIEQARGQLPALIQDRNTPVQMGAAARNHATHSVHALSGTIVLNAEEFTRLYHQQAKLTSSAAKALKDSMDDVRSVVKGLDGRLAIGSVIIQCLGLLSNYSNLSSKDLKEVRDAWYGVSDSAAGMIGGLMEMWVVVYTSRLNATVGTEAAKQSTKLMALRGAAFITGVVGGVVNAAHAFVKADDMDSQGNREAAKLLRLSGWAFSGTALTAIAGLSGTTAEWIVARQIGSLVVQRTAAGVAARMAAPMLGLTLTGWGIVLLGAGIVFQVGAVILMPTPMQKWASRSYFGTGSDKFPRGDWKAEYEALRKAVKESTEGAE
ncbi:hypothetical protein GCM10027343_12900 [Noviherbaspirillum agri]